MDSNETTTVYFDTPNLQHTVVFAEQGVTMHIDQRTLTTSALYFEKTDDVAPNDSVIFPQHVLVTKIVQRNYGAPVRKFIVDPKFIHRREEFVLSSDTSYEIRIDFGQSAEGLQQLTSQVASPPEKFGEKVRLLQFKTRLTRGIHSVYSPTRTRCSDQDIYVVVLENRTLLHVGHNTVFFTKGTEEDIPGTISMKTAALGCACDYGFEKVNVPENLMVVLKNIGEIIFPFLDKTDIFITPSVEYEIRHNYKPIVEIYPLRGWEISHV